MVQARLELNHEGLVSVFNFVVLFQSWVYILCLIQFIHSLSLHRDVAEISM